MDVADRGDHYEIRTDMPGIPKENIDIEVTPTSIEVTGRYEEREEPQEGKGWVRRERQMDYYRGLELPEEVKTDAVNAQLRDGVLTIELPKASPQQSKTKRVAVK
jgi:HSP20 family protein